MHTRETLAGRPPGLTGGAPAPPPPRRRVRAVGRRGLLVLVAVAAAAIGITVQATGLLHRLELSTIDARFAVRGAQRPDRDIVIVGLDQRSLRRLGLTPQDIPRALHARLIDRLHRDRARLIEYDIQFIGRKTAAGDGALKRAISRARPVLLATHDTDDGPVRVPAGERHPARLGAVLGSVGTPTDAGGTVRRMAYAPVELKSFDVRGAELLRGTPVSEHHFPDNAAWIDYAGGPGRFTTYSFADVLDGRVPVRNLRGHVVLVGYTDPAFLDIVQTPYSSTPMAGVEVHANALSTILRGFPLAPVGGWVNVLLILATAFVPGLLALRLPALYILGGSLLGLAALLAAVQLAFDAGAIVALVAPALSLTLAAAGTATVDALVATRTLRTLAESVDLLARTVGPGDTLGGYRIEALAGRGGMGVVYRARQPKLDRPVALKVIVPELADDADFRRRFQRESLLAAAIEHPHVVPVFEAGEDGPLLFLAMRFVDGVDLGALLRHGGPLAPARAARMLEQVAGALDAAHARGLIHRDVKPSNVLVDLAADDHAYLTDFGLARRVDSTSALTTLGGITGTIDYLSPEQIAGADVGPPADVYALGCVLYEALTGEIPFPRDTNVSKLFAHTNATVPSVRSARAELPDAVDAVIARAMAKAPADRYPSARALSQAATDALG